MKIADLIEVTIEPSKNGANISVTCSLSLFYVVEVKRYNFKNTFKNLQKTV